MDTEVEQVLDRSLEEQAAYLRGWDGGGIVEERFYHLPVLLRETVQYLAVQPGGVYIDCTVGEGGHASAILEAATPGGRLLGIDLDPHALESVHHRLHRFEGSFTLVNGNYGLVEELARSLGFQGAMGILLDLGMSSFQLESQGRGFSLQRDEPLDMRYDPEASVSAATIVNGYPPEELARIVATYGEEPRARLIARAIAAHRPIRTTLELAGLVARACGGRRGRIHPATRTFQALRIAVNSELDNLRAGLQGAIATLAPGGAVVVISYHSLEDRIVKQTLSREARNCICPPRVPVCICGHAASLNIVTRRVVTPTPEEIMENPRSRSARMRVAQRLMEG